MRIGSIRQGFLMLDLALIAGAMGLGLGLRYAGTGQPAVFPFHWRPYILVVLVAMVAWTSLHVSMNLDGFKDAWHFPSVFSKLVVAVLFLMVVILALAFVTQKSYSRLALLYFFLFFFLGIVSTRCMARVLLSSRVRDNLDHRCVILGDGPIAQEFASKIALHPELPFRIVGLLFPSDSVTFDGFGGSFAAPFRSIKTLQVLEFLRRERVQKLIVALPQLNGAEIHKLLGECRRASIQVYLVPEWYDLYLSKAELIEIDGLPLLSLRERRFSSTSFAFKRMADLLLGAAILLLVSPGLALAAFTVYCKKGRAFRTEPRCGKDGTRFQMYRLNVERATANPELYEKFLVRWSLTELPQLWNVLRGDMSLVGPRPEPPERVKYYSEWQQQRLKVPAGVTGLAQVHGLREQHSSEDKARFDLQYIFHWSPLLDLSLLLQTLWTLVVRGLNSEPFSTQAPSFHRRTSEYVAGEVADANRS